MRLRLGPRLRGRRGPRPPGTDPLLSGPTPPRPLGGAFRTSPYGPTEGEYVALDLETTGLDPSGDRIIEIGATRFDRRGPIEAFRTFVDPGRPIPREVQVLTSISDADVAGAPPPSLAVARLGAFVGGRPLVGHNVRFDLEFLAAQGFEPRSDAHDTWDLASVLLPRASRLSLAALCAHLGIPHPDAHRALADAEATRDVFLELLERLESMPRATIADLEAIARSASWSATRLFEEALDRADPDSEATLGVGRAPLTEAPLAALEGAPPVSARDIAALFDLATRRADVLPGYESRAGQREMASAVAAALVHGGQLAIEAGTGTGKSLAYLLPALLHASRTGRRVLVSTHTINLQEQLLRHDLPAAAALVEEYESLAPGAVSAATLKGRANYLCLERWTLRRHDPRPRTLPEARLHGRIATWLPTTTTGDLGELYMSSDERAAWASLSAGDADCLSRRCEFVREGSCFLLQARQRAASAHAVVVNHALLLAASSVESGALPPFEHLVIDEAHRLEEVATSQYGGTLSLRELRALLEGLAAAEGVAGRMRRAASLDPSPLSPAAGLVPDAEALATAARRARDRVGPLEQALRAYVEERRESGDAGPEEEVAITSGRASQPLWEEVEERAVEVDFGCVGAVRELERCRGTLQSMPPGSVFGLEELVAELGRATQQLQAARQVLASVLGGASDLVRWLRLGEGDARLSVAPLDVSDRLRAELLEGCSTVIATSATLSTGDSFDFALRSLGLEEAETLSIPSPYDYRRAALVIVANDIPEPDQPGHYAALHAALAMAGAAAEGRTLALFTSHGGVRQAAAALRGMLAREGVTVLAQQVDGTPARLLETLQGDPRTMLLGTAAFWEGVDVRGDTLSVVAVARLPFPVPSDPIHAGRAALYDDGFADYSLPQALLRFRQGFGRLIRGGDERGVFIVLDRRVLTRRYGEAFLDALPDCEVRRIPSSQIPAAVRNWLAR
ncbi:MAG: DEAD/DEAH box helicase [Dehalococcoidia bacterium]|nr:DEAD/DEAH box helicase [Dehalococcoidia bacterium]